MSSLSRPFHHGWSCSSVGWEEISRNFTSCSPGAGGYSSASPAIPKPFMDISLSPQKICVTGPFFLLFRPVPSFLSSRDVERILLISATALHDHSYYVLLHPSCWHRSFPVSLQNWLSLGSLSFQHPLLPLTQILLKSGMCFWPGQSGMPGLSQVSFSCSYKLEILFFSWFV